MSPKSEALPDKRPVIMTEIVLPSHANALGTIFGGVVMSWIDIAAAIAATRYARSPAVTVSIDYMQFIVPIKVGYTVQIQAQITYAGRTSMEIEVKVDTENSITGVVEPATHAFLTFVAVDDLGKPCVVTPFIPETAEEKKKFQAAKLRKEQRLKFAAKD